MTTLIRSCSNCRNFSVDPLNRGAWEGERLFFDEEVRGGNCLRSEPLHRTAQDVVCGAHRYPGELELLRYLRPWKALRESNKLAKKTLDCLAQAKDDRSVLRSLVSYSWAQCLKERDRASRARQELGNKIAHEDNPPQPDTVGKKSKRGAEVPSLQQQADMFYFRVKLTYIHAPVARALKGFQWAADLPALRGISELYMHLAPRIYTPELDLDPDEYKQDNNSHD